MSVPSVVAVNRTRIGEDIQNYSQMGGLTSSRSEHWSELVESSEALKHIFQGISLQTYGRDQHEFRFSLQQIGYCRAHKDQLANVLYISIRSSRSGINRVAWNESIAFPVGPRVKKAYMSHTRAYPRQLYGIENEWDICQVRRRSTRTYAPHSPYLPYLRTSP